MAQSGKLKDLEREYGEACETLLPRVIEEEGSIFKAAVKFGVSPNTLQYWLKRNGYRIKSKQSIVVIKDGVLNPFNP